MRRLVAIFCALALAWTFAAAWAPGLAADTGTYRIVSYRVDLTPRSDGTVAIDYHQRWQVTGGRIPWITVGTANGSFRVSGWGGAATAASPASEGDWTGVRLELDRDYGAGETFAVSFSLVQSKLFYAKDGAYRLDFTPGWYDRAAIDSMIVSVRFFASLDSVKTDPAPSGVSGDVMTWGPYSLGAGEHFAVHVSFPIALVPGGMAKSNLKHGGVTAAVMIAVLIFGFSILLVAMSVQKGVRRYSGGNIFYGGMFGGGSARGGSGGRSGSGGGGFGGASMSCACACVSCACACACAGGGAAGCARKLEHSCPVCRGRSPS